MERGPQVRRQSSIRPARAAQYDIHRQLAELDWLRTMAHAAPVAIFHCDAQGICTYVNERWSELTGNPASAAIGAPWQVGIHPDDIPLIETEWKRCERERQPFRFKHRYLQPNGRVLWVLSQLSREVDGRGEPIGYTGMTTDVTEMLQMREKVERSHQDLELRMRDRGVELQRMARIVETVDDAVVSADLNGCILSWNRGAETIFGYTAAEMIGQSVLVVAAEEHRKEAGWFEETLRTGGEIHRLEGLGRRKDGTVFEIGASGFPLRDAAGEIIGTWAIMRDISAAKRAEAELRESEARYRLLADNTDDFVVLIDTEENRLHVSPSYFRVTGWTREEIWTSNWRERIHPDDLAAAERAHAENLAGKSNSVEHRIRCRDGSWIWVEQRCRPIVDANGKVEKLLLFAREITARKEAEHQLQQLSRRLLVIQDEERRRIARELHDSTAQTLAALLMELSALAREDPPFSPARRKQLLDACMSLANEATNDLRTTAYLLHPPLLDERGLTVAITWFAGGFAKRSGLEVKLDLAPDFGRLSMDAETALFRIVQESLNNVRRHSGSARAEVRLVRTRDAVALEVRDFGSGPPADFSGTLGVGIVGMRERLLRLGGTLAIEDAGPGMAIIARLPLDHE